MKRSILALVVASATLSSVALVESPRVAYAAPAAATKPLSETLTGEAKADYESAKLLIGNADWNGALLKFSSAYEKSKDPRLLWNIAACHKNEKHYAKTLTFVRRYLSEGGPLLSAEDKKEAGDLIAVVEPLTVNLLIAANEPDADVFIDEEPSGKTPAAPILIDLNSKKVRVHKDEFEDYNQPIAFTGSRDLRIDVNLQRIKHEGKLTVNADAADDIYVDGKLVGKGTWTGVLKSGGYQLKVSAPGRKTYQSEVAIRDRDERTVPIQLEADTGGKGGGVPLWAWIGGGVVVAGGLVTAGYFIFKPSNPPTPIGTFDPGQTQAAYRF